MEGCKKTTDDNEDSAPSSFNEAIKQIIIQLYFSTSLKASLVGSNLSQKRMDMRHNYIMWPDCPGYCIPHSALQSDSAV